MGICGSQCTGSRRTPRCRFKKPILILGYVFPEDYQTLVKLDIRPAVFDYETAEKISQEAQKAGKVHPIHLAFDTGMTRIGFRHPKEKPS